MSVRAEDYFDRYEGFFGPDFAELQQGPLSIEPYVSPEFFELEKERIFRDAWFKVGHESEIPRAGDYLVKEIPTMNTTIILVRGKDDKIRAFHNVCPHRGNQLEYECGKGNRSHFVCPFHSWSFDTLGELKGLPERDRFDESDVKGRKLTEICLENWNGFLFMNPSAEPKQGFEEYLGTMADILNPYPFHRLTMAGSWEADVNCNWKVLTDAFQEGYHVTTVHRNTVPTMYRSSRSGQNRITHFQTHGPHRSFSASKRPDYAPKPVEALAGQLAGPAMIQGLKDLNSTWPGANPKDEPVPAYAFDVNVIFPSTFIDVSQGYCFTYEFYPVSVNRTRFAARMYLATPSSWSERIGQEFLKILLRENLMEDLSTVEHVQAGLESGALNDFVVSDQEIAIRHQYHVIQNMVNSG